MDLTAGESALFPRPRGCSAAHTRPLTASRGAGYCRGYFDETVEAGLGPPDAVCNSTNSHQVVICMAWVTTSTAGVRDSPGASESVEHNRGLVSVNQGTEAWEFNPGTACSTLPLARLLFAFQHFTNKFHVLHESEDFLSCKRLVQVDVTVWKNERSCWILLWYPPLSPPRTPRLMLKNN